MVLNAPALIRNLYFVLDPLVQHGLSGVSGVAVALTVVQGRNNVNDSAWLLMGRLLRVASVSASKRCCATSASVATGASGVPGVTVIETVEEEE